MTILDSSLPLGLSYWYMKQSVEMGWSSNVLKMQIDSDLYSRQISNNKVKQFHDHTSGSTKRPCQLPTQRPVHL